jgi:hypothetical protein
MLFSTLYLIPIVLIVASILNSTVVFPMPIDIIKPFLELMEKAGKRTGANGDARVPLMQDAATMDV